jgi:hypothetical protein
LAIAAVWCAPARADDASLYSAYNSFGPERSRALDAFLKASDRFKHSHTSRSARAMAGTDDRMARVLGKMVEQVRGETPSSDFGREAKRLSLMGLREWRDMHVYDARGLRAWIHGHTAATNRWWRRSARVSKLSGRHLKGAEAAFKKAGFPPSSQNRVPAHA